MNKDLIRLEYKLDLIIRALQSKDIMLTALPSMMGIESDECPVCNSPISLTISPTEGTITRNCACKLPKTAYKLTIIEGGDNASNRDKDEQVPPNSEE